MSSRTIWNRTDAIVAVRAPPAVACPSSPSSASWISVDGLPDQEQAAADQDQVAHREPVVADREHRLREPDDPRDRQQQEDPHPHREPEADRPGAVPLLRRQALHEHRDEDDVVDAQDDLEDRQGQQGDPRLGVGDPFHRTRVAGSRHFGARRSRTGTTITTVMTTRSLPVLDIAPPVVAPAGPRAPLAPDDERLEQFRPEPRALPSFFVWTLGCQMNKSDSEEMAGRLLAAGCAEAPSMDVADLVVINTCAIREAAEAKVIGRQGHLRRLKAANPGMRVVMTGCSVRESNRAGLARRYPAVDLFLRPDEEPELVDRLGLASAQAPVGCRPRDDRRPRRARSRTPRTWSALAPTRSRAAPSAAAPRSAPGCRSSTAATRPAPTASCRSAAARSGAARSTRSSTRRAPSRRPATARSTLLGQNVNSYGHDLAPEPRFGHVHTTRTVGPAPGPRGSARPRRADPRDRRPAHGRRRARDPAPAVRDLAPVGPVRPAHRSDGRLPVDVRGPAPAGPVGQRRDAAPDGPPVHDRALPGAPGPDPRGRPGNRALDRRHRRLLRRDRGRVRGHAPAARDRSATTRCSPRPTASGRGRLRRAWPTTCRPTSSARRLNGLLAVQEGIGLERNRAWIGRTTEVLVDTIVPPRSHDHDDDEARDDRVTRRVRAPARWRRAPRGPVAREQARPRGGVAVARRAPGAGPDRARGSVRPPRDPGLTLAPLVVIGGPTATGKTGLAIEVAERLIADGRPAEVDLRGLAAGVPRSGHRHGQGDARGAARGSSTTASTSSIPTSRTRVADFRAHALAALTSLGERGGIGILAGGTGFWLRAVTAGIDTDALPSDAAVRADLEARSRDATASTPSPRA